MRFLSKLLRKIGRSYRVCLWSVIRQAKYEGVNIGDHTSVSTRFWDTEPYLISIGDNCQITGGVKIFTHGGAQVLRDKYPEFDTFGKVKIGDYVYVGSNSLIMPGVTIGNHVLVAAGSVVTKSVPDNVVIAGNPARIICSIEDYLKRNLSYNTNTKGLSQKEKKLILLNLDSDKFVIKPFLQE